MPHNEDNIEEFEELPEGEVFPLETVLEFLANPDNIAGMLDDSVLTDVGNDITKRINKDEETMTNWKKFVDWGIKVNEQTTGPMMVDDGGPFDNSANFKSPIMREASLRWSDRASTEILRHKNIVKPEVIVGKPDAPVKIPEGQEVPPEVQQIQQQQQQASDEHDAIIDKGDRVTTHLNYQINFQMDWRQKHDKMLYELPNTGNVFKKTFYDPITETNETSLIHYPNFIVNDKATSLDEFPFTEMIEFTKNQVIENIRSGLWIEGELNIGDDDDFDGKFCEHQGWYDLDDDGYEEPYIITIHKATSEVVRIVPRYDIEDVFIRNEAGSLITLDVMIEALPEGQEPDLQGIDIVKIEGFNMITKYGFIPADDGSYLDWGYFHLLGHLTALVNSTTNLMLNAGKLANQPSGLLARTWKKAKSAVRFMPGEFKSTDMDPQDLASSIFTIPFKGADPSLMQLNQDITQQIRQFSSSVDMSNVLGANAPVGTTLALLQENMVSSSAIISRVYRATSDELDRLAELNFKFTNQEDYARIVGDPTADPKIDYSEDNVNVIPTANPELSSKVERIQLAEVALAQIPIIKEEGGNPVPIIMDYFDAIGYPNADKLFEQTEGQASAQQKIEQQQQELLKKQQEQTQQQLDMLEGQQAIEDRKQSLAEDKFEEENRRESALTAQKLDLNEEKAALEAEEQDRKNAETDIKEAKLPLEQNKLFEEGHKLHEEALNERNTNDRNS